MTVFSVMGSGLINAHKLGARTPKGALFVVDARLTGDVPPWIEQLAFEDDGDAVALDWVHVSHASIDEMSAAAQLTRTSPRECERQLSQYVRECSASEQWKENTRRYGRAERPEDAG